MLLNLPVSLLTFPRLAESAASCVEKAQPGMVCSLQSFVFIVSVMSKGGIWLHHHVLKIMQRCVCMVQRCKRHQSSPGGEEKCMLTSRERHVPAAQMPIVQMLPDSALAGTALHSTELCRIDTAMVTAVKCRRTRQLWSWDRLLSGCWLAPRDRGTETEEPRCWVREGACDAILTA